jgi:hypothetical protein
MIYSLCSCEPFFNVVFAIYELVAVQTSSMGAISELTIENYLLYISFVGLFFYDSTSQDVGPQWVVHGLILKGSEKNTAKRIQFMGN